MGRAAAAATGGIGVWTSFPPLHWWPAAILGAAVFVLAVRGASWRIAGAAGWVFGLGMFVPMLAFLRGLGVDAWLVVAVIEALWFALLALAVRATAPLRWWPVAVAGTWMAQEWLRDRIPFGGFPWGRLAFGQVDGPLLPAAAIGGAALVGAAAALLAGVLAWAVENGRSGAVRRRTLGWLGFGVTAAAVLTTPVLVAVPTAGTSARGPAYATVAIVQGNVPRLGLGEFDQARAVTRNHLDETLALAADVAAGRVARPELVVWPENASDLDPLRDPVSRAMVDQAVRAVGVPVLVGAVLDGPGPRHVRNAAIVWSPTTGPGTIYVKRHLVPFGEYLPFRGVLTRLVGRFSLIADDFVAGRRPGVLSVGPVRLGDVICYEVADDGVVRDVVDGGARLLTVQTNNATYERIGDSGRGGETAQQLDMSRLRAVEHGRTVLVAATSGVSAVIAPDGRVLVRAGVFVPARLVTRVPLRDPRTVADRLGAWPERLFALAGIVAMAAALRRRRRGGTPSGPPSTADVQPVMAATP